MYTVMEFNTRFLTLPGGYTGTQVHEMGLISNQLRPSWIKLQHHSYITHQSEGPNNYIKLLISFLMNGGTSTEWS